MTPQVQPAEIAPLPYWLEGVWPSPEETIKFLDKHGDLHWGSNPGPQTYSLLCPADEMLVGGRRGGGKSQVLIAWFAMGDPSLSDDDPAKFSFLNDPSFRGLILRDQYANMAEFVDEAGDFFRPFQCKAKDDPVVFEFKSGAKIYTNHLGTKEAFNKYRGWGITKIGIEELTQVPEEGWYTKLFGSLRGKKQVRVYGRKQFPKLRTQIMSTTNPDGPGHDWVKARFVKLYGGGKLIEPNTIAKDPITKLTRVYIPFRIEDNPYLKDDQKYMGMLLAQSDEVVRKQWIEGDWDAGSGQFFGSYRPDGPRGQEEADNYPWARHVIPAGSVNLQPWWFRWLGADWGYDHPAVFYKFCRNEQDKRIHVYDELSVRQVGSFEMGVLLANWCLPDLEGLPDKQMTMYLSPDAFSKTDATKTKAEQMADGIQQVLGPYGAFLLRYNDDERAAMTRDPKMAAAMFERRKLEMAQGQMCIVLKPANTDRIAGWSYIVELLRFRPILTETEEQIKQRLARIYERSGVEAYERELKEYRGLMGPEILPKMLIWSNCKGLDRCLKSAQRDESPRNEDVKKWDAENGKGGDDPLDAARHGCMAYKEIQTTVPLSYWVNERVNAIQDQHSEAFGEPLTDPTRLAMIAMRQNALYGKQHPATGGTLTLPRNGAMMHRRPN